MLTPRSRVRNQRDPARYGISSPLHQYRGGGTALGGGGGATACPPTINIVDSSGLPQQLSQLPFGSRTGGGPSAPHYGALSASRGAHSSCPNSPGVIRNAGTMGTPRGGGPVSPAANQQLAGGGGASSFYWAAKVKHGVGVKAINLYICSHVLSMSEVMISGV